MDQLDTAVVDLTTLVATCHALKSERLDGAPDLPRRVRNHLRSEIRRGALAYIDTLARMRRGAVDANTVSTCRRAAEQRMADAIGQQDRLARLMSDQPGSLEGLVAARQDLWRLAHLMIHLRLGIAALRESGAPSEARSVVVRAARLRRRLRKALVAYARASLRGKPARGVPIGAARAAALRLIGSRGAADAARLASLEASGSTAHAFIRLGVARALVDLSIDWVGIASTTTPVVDSGVV